MIPRLLTLVILCLCGWSVPAAADDNRPLTVAIREQAPSTYQVMWKVPANVEARHLPELLPPQGCAADSQVRNWSDPLGHWREEGWNCAGGLPGRTISITYPFANPNLATIARIRLAGAGEQTVLLQPHETTLAIPQPKQAGGTFADFLHLGFEHIWKGIDHLLFVAGLIFIAGTARRVLATITGFTIAHSITLALSALDLVRLPTSAIEAVIALSIVFLAVEVVKGPRDTITWRRPVVVAVSFGLLHGFGFASVLREIGLPETGMLTALFAFNLGIEAGQIIFAAAVMLLFELARRIRKAFSAPLPLGFHRIGLQQVSGYAVGVLACSWMMGRLFTP